MFPYAGDSSGFVSSPTSVFPPSATFPTPATQNAFPHKHANNQEANGKYKSILILVLLFSILAKIILKIFSNRIGQEHTKSVYHLVFYIYTNYSTCFAKKQNSSSLQCCMDVFSGWPATAYPVICYIWGLACDQKQLCLLKP